MPVMLQLCPVHYFSLISWLDSMCRDGIVDLIFEIILVWINTTVREYYIYSSFIAQDLWTCCYIRDESYCTSFLIILSEEW